MSPSQQAPNSGLVGNKHCAQSSISCAPSHCPEQSRPYSVKSASSASTQRPHSLNCLFECGTLSQPTQLFHCVDDVDKHSPHSSTSASPSQTAAQSLPKSAKSGVDESRHLPQELKANPENGTLSQPTHAFQVRSDSVRHCPHSSVFKFASHPPWTWQKISICFQKRSFSDLQTRFGAKTLLFSMCAYQGSRRRT